MPPTFSSPQVICRPALPGDKPSVLEFTKYIWGGHDYIKYVWDEWLADPQGLLAIAEYAGRAVALGKATYVAPGQWWLEGLRVDPQLQGLKIGSHIFQYLHEWWAGRLGGTFRLMTSWERVEVHHLCDRFGWVKTGEVKRYVASTGDAVRRSPDPNDSGHGRSTNAFRDFPGNELFTPVPEHGVSQALTFASANLDYCGGLIDSGWKFAAPDQTTLAQQARQNRLYWWRGNAGLLTYWDDEDDDEDILALGFIACPLRSMEAMLLDIRQLAADLGFSSVLWHAPARLDVESILAAAGYLSEWDGSAYLFEKT